MNKKTRILIVTYLIFILVTGMVVPALATPAYVEKINQKQAETQAVQEELESLDRELEIIIEQYNLAQLELQETQQKLRDTRIRLAHAENKLEGQKIILNQRASNIYKGSKITFLEFLLNIKDFNDLLTMIDFLKKVGEQDADLVYKLQRSKENIETLELEFEKLQSEQVKTKEKIETKKREIERTITARNNRLENLNEEIKKLMQEENERKAREQARLIEQIKSNLGNANINVKPGTIAATALLYLGVPYVWGGETPNGFDCSGLVKYVFAQHGIQLLHYSGYQFSCGTPVSVEALRSGDVVFFGNPVHHVGIYIGNGYFIHAPRTGDVVRVTPLNTRNDYAGARRYIGV
ncbi:NlpC/P60 family protein [Candidatus Oleimmundimicrobium sp.]|uniref:C40 family peptidase n=1 Tax=Candidatus Oleimmundimicrobium sp. TaxID=3060597 RepID=UPI002727844A|nr:NlpC/P60 family protein [Candidatus Oleimmundimicrobium sp.]MDO8886278.1 NlpC/P60 family protein [Candidatus Oleimmundimicrobium sp.]